MEFSVGIDIEKTNRFKSAKLKRNSLEFMFSDKEIAICRRNKTPHVSFAGKYCAKEAVLKALGGKIDIRNIEVLNDINGDPEIYITGQKKTHIKCSVSHIDDIAVAVAVITSK